MLIAKAASAAAFSLLLTVASARALAASPTGELNVRANCGAAGNGKNDDTARIQECIDKAGETGQAVYFPAGSYKIRATLRISSSNMLLYGGNGASTKLVEHAMGSRIFDIGGKRGQVDQVTLRDLTLEYASANPRGAAIYCRNCWRARFEHLIFGDPSIPHRFSTGIAAVGGNQVFVEDSEFNMASSRGLYFRGTGDVYLTNLEINGLPADKRTIGVVFDSGVGGIYATNVNATSGGTGFLFENTRLHAAPPNFGFFVGCLADTVNDVGWDVESADSIRLTNSWAATGRYGIIAHDVHGLNITDSRIYNNVRAGVWLEPGAKDVSIKDSTVAGNSRGDPGAEPGILVSSGVTGFQILDNKIGAADGFSVTQSYGILISPGSSDDFMVMGNDLQKNRSGEISDRATGKRTVVGENL